MNKEYDVSEKGFFCSGAGEFNSQRHIQVGTEHTVFENIYEQDIVVDQEYVTSWQTCRYFNRGTCKHPNPDRDNQCDRNGVYGTNIISPIQSTRKANKYNR